jgi:hypothetical protein
LIREAPDFLKNSEIRDKFFLNSTERFHIKIETKKVDDSSFSALLKKRGYLQNCHTLDNAMQSFSYFEKEKIILEESYDKKKSIISFLIVLCRKDAKKIMFRILSIANIGNLLLIC